MIIVLYIFFGGGLGSVIRYLISNLFIDYSFPISTLISNLLSCILIGLTLHFVHNFNLNENIKFFFLVGFCGGLSTFSAFSYETVSFMKSGAIHYAILNIIFSVLLCVCFLYFIIKNL